MAAVQQYKPTHLENDMAKKPEKIEKLVVKIDPELVDRYVHLHRCVKSSEQELKRVKTQVLSYVPKGISNLPMSLVFEGNSDQLLACKPEVSPVLTVDNETLNDFLWETLPADAFCRLAKFNVADLKVLLTEEQFARFFTMEPSQTRRILVQVKHEE